MTILAHKDGILYTDSMFVDLHDGRLEYVDDAKIIRINRHAYMSVCGLGASDEKFHQMCEAFFYLWLENDKPTTVTVEGFEFDFESQQPSGFMVTKDESFSWVLLETKKGKPHVFIITSKNREDVIFLGSSKEAARAVYRVMGSVEDTLTTMVRRGWVTGGKIHVYDSSKLLKLPKTRSKKNVRRAN